MKASEYPIKDILTRGKKYTVPSYQRAYKWDPDDAEQLIRDVHDSCKSRAQEYFIGSIICVKEDEEQFEVVDGQQRLITLTLIMVELAKLIDKSDAKTDLRSRYLSANPFSKEDTRTPILKVRSPERNFYQEYVLEENRGKISNSTTPQKVFLNNKKRIGGYLSECKMGQEDLLTLANYLLERVFVVFVEVDDRASSFRLFNVLNNRGMSLGDADLLKNTLLEKAAGNEIRSVQVENTWQEIEDLVGEEKMDEFLSFHQTSEKKDRDRAKKKNFDYYDKHLKGDFEGDSVKMSQMLRRSADHYSQILNNGRILNGSSGKNVLTLQNTLNFLKELRHSEWVPAFMAFLNKGLDREKFSEFANLFEKVYMHGWVAKLRPSQRDAACHYAIEAINNDKHLEEVLSCVRNRADNQKFEEGLEAQDFYDTSRPQIINLVKSILRRVDRERHDESVQVTYQGRITVEHILPQKMESEYWGKRFSSDQHNEWLHKLGNLTLVSGWKNSAAKNRGFDEKKKAYEHSNQKCSFRITEDLCQLPDWNMEALQKRHEQLKREIKKLWLVEPALF